VKFLFLNFSNEGLGDIEVSTIWIVGPIDVVLSRRWELWRWIGRDCVNLENIVEELEIFETL
jgi:hypothetical protein